MAEFDPHGESASGFQNLGISISSASDTGLRLSINGSSQSQSQSLSQSRALFASQGGLGRTPAANAAALLQGAHRDGFVQPGMGGIGVVVADSVFFCGEREANHLPNIQLRRVSAFLAVAREVHPPNFVQQADLDSGAARFLQLDMNDDHSTILKQHFSRAFRFLDKCRAEGHRVMIYCRQGQSRSASIAAAYVMRERRCNFFEALDHLRETRKADPNFLFCQQLDQYAREGHVLSMSASSAPTPMVIGPPPVPGPGPTAAAALARVESTVSTASVATTGNDGTPKSRGSNHAAGISLPLAHHHTTATVSATPPKHDATTSPSRPLLPSFLLLPTAASNMHLAMSGDAAALGFISFHCMDPDHAGSSPAPPILPYVARRAVSAGGGWGAQMHPAISSAGVSKEMSGPLGVPIDYDDGDSSSHKPPTIASTAAGHMNTSRTMLEASLLTNPGAFRDGHFGDDDDDDARSRGSGSRGSGGRRGGAGNYDGEDDADDDQLIPTNSSDMTASASQSTTRPIASLLDPPMFTVQPPPTSSTAAAGIRRQQQHPPSAAAGEPVEMEQPTLSFDDAPDFTAARNILSESGVIGQDGFLAVFDDVNDDDAEE